MTEKGRRVLSITHEGGTRFRIGVRGHEFVVDQPVGAGGDDAAPTPTELFVASIASCAAFYGRTYLATRGLPDRVNVLARWDVVPKPARVANVSLLVHAPGVPADREDVFRRAVEACVVHNTLKDGCDLEIEFHYAVPAAASAAG
jgi:putative redox protein